MRPDHPPSPSDSDSDEGFAPSRFVYLHSPIHNFPLYSSTLTGRQSNRRSRTSPSDSPEAHPPRRQAAWDHHNIDSDNDGDHRLSARLPQILATPRYSPACAADFQQDFHRVISGLGLQARLLRVEEHSRGLHVAIDTRKHLVQLWQYHYTIQNRLDWTIRPLPPPLLWIQLFNIPRPISENELLDALFLPHNEHLHAIKELKHEVIIRRCKKRRAYIQGPPEFRNAIHQETELTVRGRWIRTRDYCPVKVCGSCAGLDHITNECDNEEYQCGICSDVTHPADRCPHKHDPTHFQCPNCRQAGQPDILLHHIATDLKRCPLLALATQRRLHRNEYRPSVYRQLLHLWNRHNFEQDDRGRLQYYRYRRPDSDTDSTPPPADGPPLSIHAP